MILSDQDLRNLNTTQRLEGAPGIIEPWTDAHVQPASVDLVLGNELLVRGENLYNFEGKDAVIQPGVFMLGSTVERITVPNGFAARVEGKSSWGRKGLLVHATAGFIDPGFEGQITLELYNLNNETLFIPEGSRICQITYLLLTNAARYLYGAPELDSHYQGQTGPTPSALG